MRSISTAKIASVATALALLTTSAVVAQGEELRGPRPWDQSSLISAVVTNSLDETSVNQAIVELTTQVHGEMAGRPRRMLAPDPLPGADAVSRTVLDLARLEAPPAVVTVSGGDNLANVGIAQTFVSTVILDIGQQLPCVAENGQPDTTGECAGGEFAVPPNYTALEFAVEDGAYLAGVLAAKASFGEGLGVISGYADCVECNRYVHGFVNGARSVDPQIPIEIAYLSDTEAAGFTDEETARTYAAAFIDVYQPAVLLAVGRGATKGMVEAACAAGIKAVASGSDVRAAYPDLDCVLTSVTRDVRRALRQRLISFSHGDPPIAVATWDLTNEGVNVTDDWRSFSLPVDTREFFDSAESGLLTDQIDACGAECTRPLGLALGDGTVS